MEKRKIAGAVATCASVALLSLALFACTSASTGADMAETGASGSDAMPSYQELSEMYPNEFNSAMEHKSDASGTDNSHAGFQVLMETPAIRDVSGAILEVVDEDDPEKTDVAMKCVACKSSLFVDAYEERGFEVFNSEILDEDNMKFLDGQYWDCKSCHTMKDGQWVVQPQAAYANAKFFPKVAAAFEQLNDKEVVCGQCHNTVSPRNFVKSEADMQNYDPYRYGFDLDSRYKAMVEDELYTIDEATGIKMVTMNHPQVEIFQGSIHQSMGLTCVDCHMPQTTDDSGAAYTSHAASSRPSKSNVAMEKCLTCHKTQDNIGSVDEMRTWLADKQAAQAARQNEVEEHLSELYDAILAAVNDGSVADDALEQAKDKYSLANWYTKEQQQNLIDPIDGAQIAHDPDEVKQLLERADVLVEEGMALLA